MLSWPRVMACLAQVAAISLSAKAADSRVATIQPTDLPRASGQRIARGRSAVRPDTRLTSRNRPYDQEGNTRARRTRPPGATARPPSMARR